MPDYSQKITFSRTFYIKAKDAEEAEFASNLSHDGFYPFEDEELVPVEEEESDDS